MKRVKVFSLLLLIALLAASLAACLPRLSAGGLPQAAATTDKIRTQAVSTALAQLTLQALSAAPTLPTAVPSAAPSSTPLPPNPTATMEPTRVETTPVVVYNAPTYTATPAQTDYQCSVEEIEPEAGKTVKVGADFDFVVRLKNSGDKDWQPGKIFFTYTSGEKMQSKASLLPLTSLVVVDDTVNFRLDMRAPETPGTYHTTWALLQPPLYFCPVHFQIVVTR